MPFRQLAIYFLNPRRKFTSSLPTEVFSEPNTDMFLTIFGRTDLRKSLSIAKFDEESDFEVRLAVAPQKPRPIDGKRNFEIEKFRKKNSDVEK